MNWRTDVLGAFGRRDVGVRVVNTTSAPMKVRFMLVASTGRGRRQTEVLPVGASFGASLQTLCGSQCTDPATTVTSLTVWCNDGATACPAAVTQVAVPVCGGVP